MIDKYGNVCNIESKEKCAETIQQFSVLTGKHITKNDLFEHWEGGETEEFASRFCLSEPSTLSSSLLEQELFGIIQGMCESRYKSYLGIYEDIAYPKERVKGQLQTPLSSMYHFPYQKKIRIHLKVLSIRTDVFGDNDATSIEILRIT